MANCLEEITGKVVVGRGETGGQDSLFGSCLPRQGSLPGGGSKDSGGGEECLNGRILVESLIPRVFVGEGVLFLFLIHRRFTGWYVRVHRRLVFVYT